MVQVLITDFLDHNNKKFEKDKHHMISLVCGILKEKHLFMKQTHRLLKQTYAHQREKVRVRDKLGA